MTALGLPAVDAFYDDFRNHAYVGLAINEAGQVVGNAEHGAYRWTPGGRVDDIDGAEGQKAWASDVNASGQVAGIVSTRNESQPFVWEEATGLRTLRVHVGAGNESAYGVRISDRRQVAGTLDNFGAGSEPTSVAFRIEPDGTLSRAPIPQTKASDLNALGEVVLTVGDTAADKQLYVWPPGATTMAGGVISWRSFPKINDQGLVVAAAAWDESAGGECGFVWDTRTGSRTTIGLGVIPSDVNGNGWVTGVWDDGGVRHAFVWDASFGLVDLGTGSDGSYGLAINDHGQVIGGASRGDDSDDRVTSFLWDPNAGPIQLPPLRPADSTMVAGINDSGTVVGVSGRLVWDGDAEQMVIESGEPVIWSPTM